MAARLEAENQRLLRAMMTQPQRRARRNFLAAFGIGQAVALVLILAMIQAQGWQLPPAAPALAFFLALTDGVVAAACLAGDMR